LYWIVEISFWKMGLEFLNLFRVGNSIWKTPMILG
jgi:hypothetical protein